MSVDSKGICLTKNKDVFQVSKVVEKSLENLVAKYRKKKVRLDPENVVKTTDISPICEMLTFNFIIKGETRRLTLHFGCDNDHREEGFTGAKLIFSVGCWGSNGEIINQVADALSQFGPVFTIMNDCSGEKFRLHGEERFLKG